MVVFHRGLREGGREERKVCELGLENKLDWVEQVGFKVMDS